MVLLLVELRTFFASKWKTEKVKYKWLEPRSSYTVVRLREQNGAVQDGRDGQES